MKRLSLVCCVLFMLLACSTPDLPNDEPPASDTDPLELPGTIPWETLEPRDADEPHEALHPPLSDWLLQRRGVCSQKQKAIDAQLKRHQQNIRSAARSAEARAAHSQLQALMLVSCDPARTPGLFNDMLRQLTQSKQWPDDYQALFALMLSQQQAYSTLEQRFEELEARHQKTIEGIGNIERVLESQIEQE